MPLLDLASIASLKSGFAQCQIFTDDVCSENAAIQMRWTGKRSAPMKTRTNLLPPLPKVPQWQVDGQRETAVGSWRCDAKG